MSVFSWVFLLALSLSVLVQQWLLLRQVKSVRSNRSQVPSAFNEKISLDAHQTAADYTLAGLKLAQIELWLGPVILLLWTLGGGIQWLASVCANLDIDPLWQGLALLLSFTMIGLLLDMPMSLWKTFGVESKFGFNRMTAGQYVKDFFMQLLLMFLLGAPIIAAILWLMDKAGTYWWFWAWLSWMGFTLLMTWAFPVLIAPMFNKFLPLDNEQLKQRLTALLERCGFRASGMFVMDGSKRSAHGNAYFTGFGKNKRIVFYDTLLEGLDDQEVEAVLAHELGHFKHKHIIKHLLLMALMSLVGLALLGWLVQQEWFYSGLGVSLHTNAVALLLFLLIIPVFTFFLQPLMSLMSRKHEYEADAFAATQTDSQALISGLVKMYRDNANTLTPDDLYSAFYHSHPPALQRIEHLQKISPS